MLNPEIKYLAAKRANILEKKENINFGIIRIKITIIITNMTIRTNKTAL